MAIGTGRARSRRSSPRSRRSGACGRPLPRRSGWPRARRSVPGAVVVSLGTSGTAFAYSDRPAVDPRGEAAAFCDSTDGWLPLICTLGCTVATGWVSDLFGLDHAGVERALASTRPGAGPIFLPHLAGERTPSLPNGAGLFVGLRTSHGPEALVRAVLEGVTFGLG